MACTEPRSLPPRWDELGRRDRAPSGEAVAELLDTNLVVFPGDHGGFLGGEYGQTGDANAFAVQLRDVLAGGS